MFKRLFSVLCFVLISALSFAADKDILSDMGPDSVPTEKMSDLSYASGIDLYSGIDQSNADRTPPYLENELSNFSDTTAASRQNGPLRAGTVIARMFAALFLIVLMISGVFLFLKKFTNYGRAGSRGLIKMLDVAYMAPGKTIHLVEVAGKYLLLGNDSTGIKFLTEVDSSQSGVVKEFDRSLSEQWKGFNADNSSVKPAGSSLEQTIHNSISDIHSQINKLKKMKKAV